MMVDKTSKMKRTQIYLTEKEHTLIRKESEKIGIKLSELIRRILDKHLKIDGK